MIIPKSIEILENVLQLLQVIFGIYQNILKTFFFRLVFEKIFLIRKTNEYGIIIIIIMYRLFVAVSNICKFIKCFFNFVLFYISDQLETIIQHSDGHHY